MKKDKEWFIKELIGHEIGDYDNYYNGDYEDGLAYALKLAHQLDEPEKEKLYVVGLIYNHYRITRCLAYDLVDNVFFISQTEEEILNKFKKRFTEKEIKDYDERYWPFAVEVAE